MTVTVWTTFQLPLVNVTEADESVPSPSSLDESATVTSSVGSLSRTIVNVAVPPASVVTPEMALTVIAASSSSVLVRVTSVAFRPL